MPTFRAHIEAREIQSVELTFPIFRKNFYDSGTAYTCVLNEHQQIEVTIDHEWNRIEVELSDPKLEKDLFTLDYLKGLGHYRCSASEFAEVLMNARLLTVKACALLEAI